MNSGSPRSALPTDRVVLATFLLVLLAIPLLVADRQSFWIDEAMTWRITRIDDLGAAWQAIRTSLSSEALIPGYLIYGWAWTRLGGEGEAWSRMSNLPWLALLGWVWWNWARRPYPLDRIRRLAFLGLLLVSPFVLWYATEYRPYLAVIALGALTVEGISRAAGGSRAGPWIAITAALVGAAFHMLALALLACLAIQVLWSGRRNLRSTFRVWWGPALLAAIPILTGLAVYYLGRTGEGGASGMRAPLSLKNLGFIYYEFIGFLGLGPTRDALHVDSSPTVFIAALPTLALLLVPLAILAALVLLSPPEIERRPPVPEVREILRAGVIFGVGGVLLLVAAAYLVNFKILGRHVAFFQPPLLAAGAILILDRPLRWVGLPWAAMLMALAISSGRLLLDPDYERDDYRGAVRLTRQLADAGTTQLLVGDRVTFEYYRPAAVVVEPPMIPGPELIGEEVILGLFRPTWEVVAEAFPGPVLMALTRPYYYDASGEARQWALQRGGRVVERPGYFEIWRIPARSGERDE